jgi:hypothetical protein
MLNFNLFVILCVLAKGIICVMKSYFHKLSAYGQIMFRFKECGRQIRKASNMIFNVVKGTDVIPLFICSLMYNSPNPHDTQNSYNFKI